MATPPPARPGPVLPAEELLHPVPLASVALLALNDHVLKGAGILPGWVTGKLSDLAGLFFFPLLLTALGRTFATLTLRRRVPLRPAALALAIAATGLAFAALQLSPPFIAAYEAWMPRLDPLGLVRRVVVTPDPTDLLTLPVLALTWRFGRRFFAQPPPPNPTNTRQSA